MKARSKNLITALKPRKPPFSDAKMIHLLTKVHYLRLETSLLKPWGSKIPEKENNRKFKPFKDRPSALSRFSVFVSFSSFLGGVGFLPFQKIWCLFLFLPKKLWTLSSSVERAFKRGPWRSLVCVGLEVRWWGSRTSGEVGDSLGLGFLSGWRKWGDWWEVVSAEWISCKPVGVGKGRAGVRSAIGWVRGKAGKWRVGGSTVILIMADLMGLAEFARVRAWVSDRMAMWPWQRAGVCRRRKSKWVGELGFWVG